MLPRMMPAMMPAMMQSLMPRMVPTTTCQRWCTNRKTSKLWEYFTMLDSTTAVCDGCGYELSYKYSLTNFKKHLMEKHADFYVNVVKEQITPRGYHKEEPRIGRRRSLWEIL